MGILEQLGSANLIITPFILLVLLAVPLLDKKFAPAGRYALWIMVMVGLVWPFVAFVTPHSPAIPIAVNLPAANEPAITQNNFFENNSVATEHHSEHYSFGYGNQFYLPAAQESGGAVLHRTASEQFPGAQESGGNAMPLSTERASPPYVLLAAAQILRDTLSAFAFSTVIYLWVAGMIFFALYQWFKHFKLTRFLKRWRVPVPERIAAVFEAEKNILQITKKINLSYVKNTSATMLTGLIRPTIYFRIWITQRKNLV